jgi:3-carboxy-cis,cis-muconate cycloisomerase
LPFDGALAGPSTASDRAWADVDDTAWLQAMLDVEAALAAAAADAGVVPRAAADAVASCCRADRFDLADLGRRAATAGTPVIPLVADLRAAVPAGARAAVHVGATSQDVIDTSLMLLASRSLARLDGELERGASAAAALAERHRRDLAVGRTLGQHAVPVTFGLTAATWLMGLVDARALAARVAAERLAVQLGGAAGTLAPLGDAGPAVVERLAAHLGLAAPPLPWHTTRGRTAELAATLAVVAGSLGRVATDVIALARTEVGEVREGSGGGSSTMPHKRNPVRSILVVSAAHQVNGLASIVLGAQLQEHQRAAGPWQAEWEPMRTALALTVGAAERLADVLDGLEVDVDRMRSNLALTGGMVMTEAVTTALVERGLDAAQARAIVEAAVDMVLSGRESLSETLAADPVVAGALDPRALEHALEPGEHLGATDAFIDHALAHAPAHAEVSSDASRGAP